MIVQKQTSRREFVSGSLALVAGALSPLASGVAAESSGDWTVSTADAGIDRSAIQRVLDDARSVTALRSILVVKNGALIGEQYYGGTTASDLQGMNSVTKSIASMLVGIAIQQGRIRGLSETVATLLPSSASKAPGAAALSITLEQILSDTSGLVYDYRVDQRALDTAEDPVAFVLGLPVDPQKVGRWVYNDAAISLLSPILVQAQGMPVDQVAQRDLFRPLGIERVEAARDKAGNFMSYRGLRLRARDLAKIGWSIANDGRWGDKQIVPKDWVRTSTSFHVPTTWSAAPIQKTGYGYLWFTGNLNGHPVAWAWGYGAQFAVVVPSLRLAVTTTATNPHPRDLNAQTNAVMAVVAQIVAVAV
jgi:CubicO group peptidase (beta-lactamase class C family)